MNDILRDLLLNGFVIFPRNGKFILKKESMPCNPTVISEMEFESCDEAIDWATNNLHVQVYDWIVTVRFNRGLGIEYKNLPDVQASTLDYAKTIAKKEAERHFIDPKVVVSEVRVRLKK